MALRSGLVHPSAGLEPRWKMYPYAGASIRFKPALSLVSRGRFTEPHLIATTAGIASIDLIKEFFYV